MLNRSTSLAMSTSILKALPKLDISYFFKRANTIGADQTEWVHRLICAFVVSKQQNQVCLVTRPIWI